MTYNSLAPKIKLPYQMVRGTVTTRQNKATHMVDVLYKDLYPKLNHSREIPIEEVQKSVTKVLKNKCNIKVLATNGSDIFDGGNDIFYSPYTGSIIGQTLEVESPKKKITIEDLITIVHEFQHVMDNIFQPKYMARNQYMVLEDLYTKKYNNLYDNYIYESVPNQSKRLRAKTLRKMEYRIRKFLKSKSIEDRINYIQDTKYTLQSEAQAYRTQLKYAKIHKKKHLPLKEYDLEDNEKVYMFREKIEILNKLGIEYIQNYRHKHKSTMKLKEM